MVILVMMSAIIGRVITIVLLWPYGMAWALIGAPFGGSLLALAVILLVVTLHSAKRRHARSDTAQNVVDPKDSTLS
jgi:hypothetical protein